MNLKSVSRTDVKSWASGVKSKPGFRDSSLESSSRDQLRQEAKANPFLARPRSRSKRSSRRHFRWASGTASPSTTPSTQAHPRAHIPLAWSPAVSGPAPRQRMAHSTNAHPRMRGCSRQAVFTDVLSVIGGNHHHRFIIPTAPLLPQELQQSHQMCVGLGQLASRFEYVFYILSSARATASHVPLRRAVPSRYLNPDRTPRYPPTCAIA